MAFSLRRIDDERTRNEAGSGTAPTLDQLRLGLRRGIERMLTPVAAGLHRIGVSPNQVSVVGFAANAAAAALIVTGRPVLAGTLYLVAGALDLLDGVVARLAGRQTRFGAFLDSTLDRASEGIVFAALGYHFAAAGEALDAGLVVLALLGSFLVSYVRARAEALGARCSVGIATRAERVVLIALGLLSGLLAEAVHLVVVLTAVTAAQRIARARRELQSSTAARS